MDAEQKDLRFENRRKKVASYLKKLYDATNKPTQNIKIFQEIGEQVDLGSIGATRSLLVNKLHYLAISKTKDGDKVVMWTGPEPNLSIADKVTHELADLFRSYGKVDVEVKQDASKLEPVMREVSKIETVIEKGDRSDKEFRVHMFMQFLYEKVRDLMLSDTNLDLESRLKQYSHEPEIIDILVANKLLDRERNKNEVIFIWIGAEPDNEMAKKVTDDLKTYLTVEKIRSSFELPIKSKTFNNDEVKVIAVLKENGKQFSEISKIVERSESDVKKLYYDYLIKTNS